MYGWYTPRDCKEMQPSTFGNFIFKIRGVLGGEREECETQSKRVKLVQLQFDLINKGKGVGVAGVGGGRHQARE